MQKPIKQEKFERKIKRFEKKYSRAFKSSEEKGIEILEDKIMYFLLENTLMNEDDVRDREKFRINLDHAIEGIVKIHVDRQACGYCCPKPFNVQLINLDNSETNNEAVKAQSSSEGENN